MRETTFLALRGKCLAPKRDMATAATPSRPSDSKLHGRRILVCLDRSAFSEVCVPYAVSFAKAFGSDITLLHVMQPHQEQSGPQPHDALSWEISRQEAQGYLEKFGKEASLALGHPVSVRLEQGHPAERIVDLAHEIGADLTVLGSHGEDGITPWTLGSTVQQVLAIAHNSVLIAPSSSTGSIAVTPRRILVPLDGSLRSESVLPAATHLASAHDADILLVHVVQEPLPTPLLHAAEGVELAQKLAVRVELAAKRYLQHLQERLAHQGTSVHTLVVRHANERQCLLDIARKEQTDLIILSAHGAACDSARSFGSVTTFLLTHSIVPLLVIQDLPEGDLHRAQDIDAKLESPHLRASYASESV